MFSSHPQHLHSINQPKSKDPLPSKANPKIPSNMHFHATTFLSALALLTINQLVVGAALDPRTIATDSCSYNPYPL